jgi:hypothetical protein
MGGLRLCKTDELQAALGQRWSNAEVIAFCAPQYILVELPA